MPDYPFYMGSYRGDSIPKEEFPRLAARAEAQLEQYKRIYRVTGTAEAEDKALCAMADALYYFEQAQNGGSVSIGSVSESRGAGVDVSPRAQAAELYRCARLYLHVYRG